MFNAGWAILFHLRLLQRLLALVMLLGLVAQVQGQYMGLLRFTPKGWSEVLRIRSNLDSVDQDSMHMTGTLQQLINAGRLAVAAVPYTGTWGEVDSKSDLDTYQ